MDENTTVESAGTIEGPRLDQTAMRGLIVISIASALIIAAIAFGSASGVAWMKGWMTAAGVVVILLGAVVAFDLARPKNVAWRLLGHKFGQPFREVPDRDKLSAGRGQLGENWYFGIRCFASPEGLEINRIVSPVNPPLSIPWSAIGKIDTFPSLLTGRQGFETDMQAQITLNEMPALTVEVPWLMDFRKFLPKSVKYRSIKLSKK